VSEDRIEADSQQLGTKLAETIVCVSKLRQFMSSDRSEIEAIEYQHHRTLTQGSRERKLISSSRLESEVWRGIVNLQRRHSLLPVPRSQLLNMYQVDTLSTRSKRSAFSFLRLLNTAKKLLGVRHAYLCFVILAIASEHRFFLTSRDFP
jgi:hypothetical protein